MVNNDKPDFLKDLERQLNAEYEIRGYFSLGRLYQQLVLMLNQLAKYGIMSILRVKVFDFLKVSTLSITMMERSKGLI